MDKLHRNDLKFDYDERIIIEWTDAKGIPRSTRRKVTSDVKMSLYVCGRRRYLSEMEQLPDYTSIPIFDDGSEKLEAISRFRIRPEDVDPSHISENAFVRHALGKHNPKYYRDNLRTDEKGYIFIEWTNAQGETVRKKRLLRGSMKTCVNLFDTMILLEDMRQLPDESGISVFKHI